MADAGYPAAMACSLWSVILGTLTLRFSTGLTGALLVYYLADLPKPVSYTHLTLPTNREV